jgi:hypothetical protein
MDTKIGMAEQIIAIAWKNEIIRNVLAGYNFNEERFERARELRKRVSRLTIDRNRKISEKLVATKVLKDVSKKAKKVFIEFLQLARLVFKDDSWAAQVLGLKGRRKQTIAGWLDEAKQFYTNALNETKILDRFSSFGITRERLEAGKAVLVEVEEAAADQERKKGNLLQATRDLNQAIKELDQAAGIIKRLASFGLRGGPKEQLLEGLGITVPSKNKKGLKNLVRNPPGDRQSS